MQVALTFMAGFRETLERAAQTFLCLAVDELANVYALTSDLLDPLPGTQYYENTAQIIRTICDREPPPPPRPQFIGGQCECIKYLVTLTVDRRDGDSPLACRKRRETYTHLVYGEIKNIYLTGSRAGICGEEFNSYVIVCRGRGENPRCGELRPESFSGGRYLEITSISVVREDRQPDNCGSLPPVPVPPPEPGWNQTQQPITYTNRDGLDVTIPVGFFLAQAFFDANLDLQIPVYVTVNADISFPINFNISTGDIVFKFGGSEVDEQRRPIVIQTPPPPGTPIPNNYRTRRPPPPPPPGEEFEDTEEEPDPEARNVIRGVIVTVEGMESRKITTLSQNGGNPDVLIPDLGLVQFQIQIGRSTSWTNDIRVKNLRSFIPCPWEGGAIDVRGTPQPYVTWNLTPVYAKSSLPGATT